MAIFTQINSFDLLLLLHSYILLHSMGYVNYQPCPKPT